MPTTLAEAVDLRLAEALAESQSATLYVDLPNMTQERAEALLLADPPLHVEFDEVRQLWSVRKASDQEVEAAKAEEAAETPPPAPAKPAATTAASSRTSA